jgi:uncharacterized protein YdeI (YjbR/CyaY-like superfamily)
MASSASRVVVSTAELIGPDMKPRFFRTPAELRKWFTQHHATEKELWVGYYKVSTGRPTVTWAESVDEALCVGWIDGIRRSIDDESYTNRFTPRKIGSTWSAVNIKRVKALVDEKRMMPAGLKAFEARREYKSGIYSYEQRRTEFDEPYLSQMKSSKNAWEFFQAQPPSYRKMMIWFVVSAKQEATREKRLKLLIDASARGRRL